MANFEIIDKRGILTSFGEVLINTKDEQALLREIAKRLLLDYNGEALLHTIKTMQSAGITTSLESINRQLYELNKIGNKRGGGYSPTAKNVSGYRNYFAAVGLLPKKEGDWTIDESVHRDLLSGSCPIQTMSELCNCTPNQRIFLKKLSEMQVNDKLIKSADVREALYNDDGVNIPAKSLSTSVVKPLKQAGLLEFCKTTQGRGAKPHLVGVSKDIRNENLIKLIDQLNNTDIDKDLVSMVSLSYEEISIKMKSPNEHEKGLALEALAFRVMRQLGFEFLKHRYHGADSSWPEIDLLFRANRIPYETWQVQCKNTNGKLSSDRVLREIGLAQSTRSSVILFLSAGGVQESARICARRCMEKTALSIIFFDKTDIDEIADDPIKVHELMATRAKACAQIKDRVEYWSMNLD